MWVAAWCGDPRRLSRRVRLRHVPGSCREPGHNCDGYSVPIAVFLIVMAFVWILGGSTHAAKLRGPDGVGNIYVVEHSGQRVQRFGPAYLAVLRAAPPRLLQLTRVATMVAAPDDHSQPHSRLTSERK